MNATSRFLLPLVMIVAGCSTLGGGDLETLRNVSQGRYDRIQTVSIVLDRLIAQPAPSNLTPQERQAWNDQTAWLMRTKTKLLDFAVGLKRVIDAPHPSGTGMDGMISAAQLASDYTRLGEDFASLMSEVTVEARADEQRVAVATGVPVTPRDSTLTDSLGSGGIAVSSPLKTRHESATNALSGLT